MIYSTIYGGLGNQLFQYAAGRALSLRLRTPLKLDARFYGGKQRGKALDAFRRHYMLDRFQTAGALLTPTESAILKPCWFAAWHPWAVTVTNVASGPFLPRVFVESDFRYDANVRRLKGSVYLRGYFQTPFYFEDVADQIRRDLRPRDEKLERDADALIQRAGDGRPVVSVHVRRGDLAMPNASQYAGYAPFTLEFFEAAKAVFPRDVAYLVFSDDIEWCRANLEAPNISFSDGTSAVGDLVAMSRCDHHIISTSTFSWWAAWLNARPEKQVVLPKKWFVPPFDHMDEADLVPSDWIRV